MTIRVLEACLGILGGCLKLAIGQTNGWFLVNAGACQIEVILSLMKAGHVSYYWRGSFPVKRIILDLRGASLATGKEMAPPLPSSDWANVIGP